MNCCQTLLSIFLCVAVLSGYTVSAPWPSPLASLPPSSAVGYQNHDNPWENILKALYERTESSVGFCLGSNPYKVLQLIRTSFPWPLPVEEPSTDSNDSICTNRAAIAAHLCGPSSIETYYRFMLLTEDPEKVPPTKPCPDGITKECSPGFFRIKQQYEQYSTTESRAHACCPGYFCPANLVCMTPCPFGAYCPRATPALPPQPYHQRKEALWCAPYAYRRRPKLGCGGADRWSIIPQEAFQPGSKWDAGSGNIYCMPRYYCPNTTTAIQCPRGHFCRQGSSETERCPPGSVCPKGMEVPLSNFGGVLMDMLLLGVLSLLWAASSYRRRVILRLGPGEKIKVIWKKYGPRYVIIKASQSYTTARAESEDLVVLPAVDGGGNNDAAPTTPALDIEFHRLSLKLLSCGRVVLSNISGQFKPAHLTALMGPSGAGKSSLLNALAGRTARYAKMTGEVFVNGIKARLDLPQYRRITGFVPQDDIVYSELTVEENLRFSARIRLPAGTAKGEHQRMVASTLAALGLEELRREIVGDEANRGISGGQRKRVSIGLELVAAPKVLLLDEPTSGLDAFQARSLISTLLHIVRTSHVTAAAVVHQPRHEAFLLFDDLILLGPGGRTAFYGPVSEVEGYFLSLGHIFPERTNPADALLDLVAAEPAAVCAAWENRSSSGGDGEIASAEDGAEASDQSSILLSGGSSPSIEGNGVGGIDGHSLVTSSFVKAREAAILAATAVAHACIALQKDLGRCCQKLCRLFQPQHAQRHGYAALPPHETEYKLHLSTPSPGFWRQFIVCFNRAFLLRAREPLQTFTDVSIIAATGMTVGLLSDRGRATIMSYASSVSYSVIALGLTSTVEAIPTFTNNEASFRREAASGLNRAAYFTALVVFDLLGSIVRSAVYIITWASFSNPKANLFQMYLTALGIGLSCSGTGYVLALALGPESAQLAAAVVTLVSTLVARKVTTGALAFLQQFSFARWALEGFVIAESNRLTGVWLLARCADLMALGYDVRRFLQCLACLAALGVGARIIALAMLLNLS